MAERYLFHKVLSIQKVVFVIIFLEPNIYYQRSSIPVQLEVVNFFFYSVSLLYFLYPSSVVIIPILISYSRLLHISIVKSRIINLNFYEESLLSISEKTRKFFGFISFIFVSFLSNSLF